MKAIKPPTLTLLAALLLTGCSGSHWALPDHGDRRSPRQTPDHFRGATQMVLAPPGSPDVPGPAGLPVVLAAWWWSRRLRDCDRP